MHVNWTHFKRLGRWLSAVAIAGVLVPTAGEFFISWATKHKFYDDPDAKVATAVGWMLAWADSSYFKWATGIVVGFTIGSWLDGIFGPSRIDTIDSSSVTKISQIKPVLVSTVLRLQFLGGRQSPLVIHHDNILSWYMTPGVAGFLEVQAEDGGISRKIPLKQTWLLLIIFDRPVKCEQMIAKFVSSDPFDVSLVAHNKNYAVISSDDEIPGGILEFYTVT